MDSLGNFVVTWASANQDGSGKGIYAQRYDNNGKTLASEFRVNTTTANDQQSPTVAMDNLGNFTIAWASNLQDGSGWGIYAQRYDNNGNARGTETQVNTTTMGDQINPSAAADSNGNVLVTWTSSGQDGSGLGVYGQIISGANGTKVDGEFRVNKTTAGDQQASSVAVGKLGKGVVVWTGVDASGTGVFAANLCLVEDAYEVEASESRGTLTVTGAAGPMQIQMHQTAPGPQAVNVVGNSIVNTGAGNNILNIFDARVGGPACLTTGSGNDSITLFNTQFEGPFNLNTDSSDDYLVMNHLAVAGKKTALTGSGDDTVARSIPCSPAPSPSTVASTALPSESPQCPRKGASARGLSSLSTASVGGTDPFPHGSPLFVSYIFHGSAKEK